MKKTFVSIMSITMVLSLLFCLSGCGVSEKKQQAIDKHTAVSVSFNEVANLINENKEALGDEIISNYQQMSDLLNQYTEILNGNAEITDEKYDEMIAWFDQVKEWIEKTKAEIEERIGDVG